MQAIQSLLTFAIEATAIIGFGGIVAKAFWSEHQRWMATYCPPVKPYSPATAEATKIQPEQPEAPEITDSWTLELDEQIQPKRLAIRHFSQQLALPPTKEVSKPQQPAFNGYSQSRLRKIAKELRIKRYSVMSTQQLMTAIAKHPASQALMA